MGKYFKDEKILYAISKDQTETATHFALAAYENKTPLIGNFRQDEDLVPLAKEDSIVVRTGHLIPRPWRQGDWMTEYHIRLPHLSKDTHMRTLLLDYVPFPAGPALFLDVIMKTNPRDLLVYINEFQQLTFHKAEGLEAIRPTHRSNLRLTCFCNGRGNCALR